MSRGSTRAGQLPNVASRQLVFLSLRFLGGRSVWRLCDRLQRTLLCGGSQVPRRQICMAALRQTAASTMLLKISGPPNSSLIGSVERSLSSVSNTLCRMFSTWFCASHHSRSPPAVLYRLLRLFSLLVSHPFVSCWCARKSLVLTHARMDAARDSAGWWLTSLT